MGTWEIETQIYTNYKSDNLQFLAATWLKQSAHGHCKIDCNVGIFRGTEYLTWL